MDIIELLSEEWKRCGVNSGDMLLLHSDIIRTLVKLKQIGFPPDPNIILDSFIRSVGPDGTILFPVFNFGFCEGKTFDIKNTPSHMGVLSEIARTRANTIRTCHPVYSFAVLGGKSEIFRNVNNKSGYGKNSPFGILREYGGKIAILDIEENASMTFHHHVEEMCGVSYRFMKSFTGGYIDESGSEDTKTYTIYVRNLERGVKTALNPLGDLIWSEGIYAGDRPNKGCGLRVCDANKVFDYVSGIIRSGCAKGTMYTVENGHDR